MKPPFKGMLIIVLMIEGAFDSWPVKLESHLMMIKRFMYPNRTVRRMIWGTNSKKKSVFDLKVKELNAFMHIPKLIWETPKMTLIFIFKELTNVISFLDQYHL